MFFERAGKGLSSYLFPFLYTETLGRLARTSKDLNQWIIESDTYKDRRNYLQRWLIRSELKSIQNQLLTSIYDVILKLQGDRLVITNTSTVKYISRENVEKIQTILKTLQATHPEIAFQYKETSIVREDLFSEESFCFELTEAASKKLMELYLSEKSGDTYIPRKIRLLNIIHDFPAACDYLRASGSEFETALVSMMSHLSNNETSNWYNNYPAKLLLALEMVFSALKLNLSVEGIDNCLMSTVTIELTKSIPHDIRCLLSYLFKLDLKNHSFVFNKSDAEILVVREANAAFTSVVVQSVIDSILEQGALTFITSLAANKEEAEQYLADHSLLELMKKIADEQVKVLLPHHPCFKGEMDRASAEQLLNQDPNMTIIRIGSDRSTVISRKGKERFFHTSCKSPFELLEELSTIEAAQNTNKEVEKENLPHFTA